MARTKGVEAIDPATAGGIILATSKYGVSNAQVGRDVGHDESVVRRLQNRLFAEADKENISPLEAANTKQP